MQSKASTRLTVLGKRIRKPLNKLECFPKPEHVMTVTLTCTEFTSLCPVTGQPDFQTAVIEYAPRAKCVESKSLKLYLWTYREQGAFCEALSARIAQDIVNATDCHWCRVTIDQVPRGGIAIKASAEVKGSPATS
ncbi:MAG: preQ(1) synthase [Thermoflexales bacterium]